MTDYSTFFTQHWALMQQADLYRPCPNPTFENPAFARAEFRVLIARLSPFRDVDRSTPHLFLSQAARQAVPACYVDMAFFPPQHDRERLLEAGVPLWVGTQSWHSFEDFDVVLVSNAYTLELINLPYVLLNARAPVRSSARGEAWPPILLGGSNALAAQALVTEGGDCVADALFFGEGEREVARLLRGLARHRDLPKHARLLEVSARVTGLWVANGPPDQHVGKAICAAPQGEDVLVDYPLLNSAEANTARLQINYGCPAFCSFCFEGYDRKPYREVPLADALDAALQIKRKHGPEAVDLYSFNFNTYADIMPLLLALNQHFDRVGFKSQRVDILAAWPDLLRAEVLADKRSFTLGIEGISRRMRAFLHKSLEDVEIEAVLVQLLREKIREIKLFYILTGHETEDDIAEFRDFARALKETRQRLNRGLRVIFSFGFLLRMPFTPLRYDRLFLEEEDWRQIVGPVKSACETNTFEFRLATLWDEYAVSQVLALGGHWLHEPVLALAERGHCYDLNLTPGYWDALRDWMQARGHWDPALLNEKGPAYAFPLAFVKSSIDAGYLYEMYCKAREGVDSGYCLENRCRMCGACRNVEERRAITAHTLRHPGAVYLRTLEDVMRAKWQLQPVYARLWLPPDVVGARPAWCNAWVMARLLATCPDLADTLLVVQESLFTTKDNIRRYAGMYGETIFALKAWDVDHLMCSLNDVVARGNAGPMLARLEWVAHFEPGNFQNMDILLTLPTEHFPDAGQRMRRFLQQAYVPVNIRREGAGYRFDISAKARKKRVIFSGAYVQDAERFVAELTVSPKFDLVAYLRSFDEPERYREARVEVRHIVVEA